MIKARALTTKRRIGRWLSGVVVLAVALAAPAHSSYALEGATWDEVLVVLHEQAGTVELSSLSARAPSSVAVADHLWQTAQPSQQPLKAWLDRRGLSYRAYYIVNALLVRNDGPMRLSRAFLEELARRPEVAHVLTNPRISAGIEPVGPRVPAPASATAVEWGVQRIGAPQVWALGYRGEGVVVAGQDTGYQWNHPALIAQYRGWDGFTADHDYNWHDAIHVAGGSCPPDSPVPCDDHGHGTHTMGTMVGDDGAGNRIGVAPGAQWIGCRNMQQGVGTPASYIECFEFFLAPYPVGGDASQRDPSRAPHVINNSWSCPPSEGCDAEHIALLEQTVNAVRAAGILVVASAGNSGPTCGTVSAPPGMYDAAYSVGATDSSDAIAAFSSRGTGSDLIKPDLAAPGVGVRSSVPGGYTWMSGTSMASPHVAGAAALLWSARPDLLGEVATTEYLLNTTAVARTSSQCGDEAEAVPNTVYGWGRLDAYRAVERATAGTLLGVVSDLAGGPLGGVDIRAQRLEGGLWETWSAAGGAYLLKPVSGTYTITAALAGYQEVAYDAIRVTAGLTTTLDIVLHVETMLHLYLPLVVH